MPQNSLAIPFQNQAGAIAPGHLDAQGESVLVANGLSTALNITAAKVVKTGAGRCVRLIIINAGSAGSWTLNDCATTGAAAAANELFTVAQANAAAGSVFTIDAPVSTGLTVSAVATGGQAVLVYS